MARTKEKKASKYFEEFCDKVGEIAIHYGFSVVKPPHITSEDVHKSKEFRNFDHYGDAEEKIALTRWYINERMDLQNQPISFHYKKPLHGASTKKKPSVEMYGLEIMGSNKSTSEALIIKSTLAILEDLGYKNLFIDINSIGDKESINKFERDLASHFRKHGGEISAKTRGEFKKNPYSILKNSGEDTKEFMKNAPQTIGSLSEISRAHFREVLESLETFETPYKIKGGLLSNKLYASYTVFEIREISEKKDEDGELLAYGYRYNSLAKKLGAKREIPSMGVTIMIKKDKVPSKKIAVKNVKKPHFYLVQLGGTAKLKALNIVEMLRKNKIPVHHSITKDKITGQLSGAEYMKSSHVLIMGQKEAIENSVVVRNITTREQETVPVGQLAEFLKNVSKK